MHGPSLACRLALRGSRSLPRIADVCSLACERISHVWAGGQRRGRRASRAPIARDAPRCVSRALPSPWIAHAITGTRVNCTAFDRGKPVRRVLARDGAEDALASFARDPPNTAKGRALAEAEARECSVEAPSRPRKREGRPDRSGRPSFRVTGWRQPVDRSRDHGATVNCTAFDRLLVEGAGGSRNHSWALNTSPANSGLPIAVGRVAR